jgi:hypothetical protein
MLDFVTVANSVMDMEDIHKKQQQQNNKHWIWCYELTNVHNW